MMTFDEIKDLIDDGPQTIQCNRHENTNINGQILSFGPNINLDVTKRSDRISIIVNDPKIEALGPPHGTLELIEYMEDGTVYVTGRGGPFGLFTRRKQITFGLVDE
jgi:hypothetical protein